MMLMDKHHGVKCGKTDYKWNLPTCEFIDLSGSMAVEQGQNQITAVSSNEFCISNVSEDGGFERSQTD